MQRPPHLTSLQALNCLLQRTAKQTRSILERATCEQFVAGWHGSTCLLLLWHDQASNAAELSRRLGYDAGAMTRIVDALEQAGLLRRKRAGPDRRSVTLEITDLGKQTAQRVEDERACVVERVWEPFTATEIADLTRLQDKLSRHLDAIAGDRRPCGRRAAVLPLREGS